jgi:protein PhnA
MPVSTVASATSANTCSTIRTGHDGDGRIRDNGAPRGKQMMDIKVRDSNGTQLADGDTVTLIKDLKLKGSSTVLKRGTVIKNIRLTDNEEEIEGRTDKVKGLVLRTEFLKKA